VFVADEGIGALPPVPVEVHVLEAFIAAQLLDFPADLKIERAPDRVNAGVAVPFRLP